MRALILDDSRATRLILRRILAGMGFEVVEAENGREGMARLKEGGLPDVVTVDWDMPEMDGLSFVKAARSDPAYASVPLIMVATRNEPERIAAALEAGANEYVMKPFTEEIIREKLDLLRVSLAHS